MRFAFVIGALLTGNPLCFNAVCFYNTCVRGIENCHNLYAWPTNQFAVIPATFFFFGGLTILFMKGRKIHFQERALKLAAVPVEPEFVLTETTAATVLSRIHALVDHPRHFVLLNRIDRALSNFRNIGQVNDVSSILRTQAENDEDCRWLRATRS